VECRKCCTDRRAHRPPHNRRREVRSKPSRCVPHIPNRYYRIGSSSWTGFLINTERRLTRPVSGFGSDPLLCLCLCLEIPDVGIGPGARLDAHKPSTASSLFGAEIGQGYHPLLHAMAMLGDDSLEPSIKQRLCGTQ
jgi:hypothetical protein